MEINTEKREVHSHGVLSSTKFSVDNSAHMMRILARMYTNPIAAIVRELLTNMLDAYIALKEKEGKDAVIIPPILHAPTAMNPVLKFEDFGIGMSKDTVMKVFTGFGKSTKSSSNSQVGGFGLGAKTPFAYNGGVSWSVESRFEGKKMLFIAAMGEDNIPQLDHVRTEKTTEHSGVTIMVPILRQDITKVEDAVRAFVPYYNHPLEVQGMEKPEDMKYRFRADGWGLLDSARSRYGNGRVKVVMGNVPYPVEPIQIPNMMYNFFYHNSVDLFVDIGTLDLVPSRDGLEYTPKTIASLKAAFDKFMKGLSDEIGKRLASSKTEWDMLAKYKDIQDIHSIHTIISKLTWNGKEVDVSQGIGILRKVKNIIKLDKNAELSVYALPSNHRSLPDLSNDEYVYFGRYNGHGNDASTGIIMVNDLTIGGVMAAKAYIVENFVIRNKTSGRAANYGHDTSPVALLKTTATIDEISEWFGGFPKDRIILASTVSTKALKGMYAPGAKSANIYKCSPSSGRWETRVRIPANGAKIFYYLKLTKPAYQDRYNFEGRSGDEMLSYIRAAEVIGLADFSREMVYGIREDEVSKFDAAIWVDLKPVLEKEVPKFVKNNIGKFAEMMDRDSAYGSARNGEISKMKNIIDGLVQPPAVWPTYKLPPKRKLTNKTLIAFKTHMEKLAAISSASDISVVRPFLDNTVLVKAYNNLTETAEKYLIEIKNKLPLLYLLMVKSYSQSPQFENDESQLLLDYVNSIS